jgi:phenylalanyl-tRNA synthetase beta subunit
MLAIGILPVKKKKGVSAEVIIKEDIQAIESILGISLKAKVVTGDFGAMCELDLDDLVAGLPEQKNLTNLNFKSLPSDKKYQKFSLYPYIVRDVAVFVPEETSEQQVHELIKAKATKLCIKSELFDVFTKDFPEGKRKSLAFRLIFQSFEKTLEDIEVNEIMDTIYQELTHKSDWQIR